MNQVIHSNTEIKQTFRSAPPRPNVQFSDGRNVTFRAGNLPPIPENSNSRLNESNYYDPIRHIESADCSRQNSATDGSIQVKKSYLENLRSINMNCNFDNKFQSTKIRTKRSPNSMSYVEMELKRIRILVMAGFIFMIIMFIIVIAMMPAGCETQNFESNHETVTVG